MEGFTESEKSYSESEFGFVKSNTAYVLRSNAKLSLVSISPLPAALVSNWASITDIQAKQTITQQTASHK